MLPHVIITRSYCSPAGLLPPLSWRGSGQGQTGRAGRAETEYYHWRESCFMLLSGRGQRAGCTVTWPDSEQFTFQTLPDKFVFVCIPQHTHRLFKEIYTSQLPPVMDLFKRPYTPFCRRTLHLHTKVSGTVLPPARPPWRLRGQYLTLPPATLSSVTHGSHSIQAAG